MNKDKDITDEEMFIELLLDNNQAELSPLERGKHAFVYTEKYDRSGKSVSKYAERLGENLKTISANKNAFIVFDYYCKSSTYVELLNLTAFHFRIIHSAPRDYWLLLVKSAIEYNWSTDDLTERVKGIKTIEKISNVFGYRRKMKMQALAVLFV